MYETEPSSPTPSVVAVGVAERCRGGDNVSVALNGQLILLRSRRISFDDSSFPWKKNKRKGIVLVPSRIACKLRVSRSTVFQSVQKCPNLRVYRQSRTVRGSRTPRLESRLGNSIFRYFRRRCAINRANLFTRSAFRCISKQARTIHDAHGAYKSQRIYIEQKWPRTVGKRRNDRGTRPDASFHLFFK